MILFILIGIPLLSLVWLVWANRRLKKLQPPRWVSIFITISIALLLTGYIWVILSRAEHAPKVSPLAYSFVLLWGILSLPLIALPSMVGWSIFSIFRKVSGKSDQTEAPESPPVDEGRRQLLGAVAVALPVIATFGAAAIAIPQRNRFRIREIRVPIANLPKDLHGLRIAHLSDTHVGKFTSGKVLVDLAEATNKLKADLVLLTGDLIDNSLDDLPEALDMVGRLDPRSGLYLIEGNHDLFHGPEQFGQGVIDRGFNLLRDETAVVTAKGHPIELLGIRWNQRGTPIETHIDQVMNEHNPEALPILLAHHPHAFDHAAKLGIPLTLAGHTHGGQLMLTPEIGAGPMMFKYWSGLYQKPDANLVVSNGAGNWFPLRTASPAEIVHVTLIRA
ncbi:MAG TPA: metallophosphoesterase [Luteolibacter sp.]|nr:metallophosphoesterase [Luteolibacter sp.]